MGAAALPRLAAVDALRDTLTSSPLDACLEEVSRLRAAIAAHRDAVQGDERSEWLEGYDIELWLTLKEN